MKDEKDLGLLAEQLDNQLRDSVIIGNHVSDGQVILKGAKMEGDRWRIHVITIMGMQSLSTRAPSQQIRRYGQESLRFLDPEEYIARIAVWRDMLTGHLGVQLLLYSGRTIEIVGDISIDIMDGELAEKEYHVPKEVRLPKSNVEIGHDVKEPVPMVDETGEKTLDEASVNGEDEIGASMGMVDETGELSEDEMEGTQIVEIGKDQGREEENIGKEEFKEDTIIKEEETVIDESPRHVEEGETFLDANEEKEVGEEVTEHETKFGYNKEVRTEVMESGGVWRDPEEKSEAEYKDIDDIEQIIEEELEKVEEEKDKKLAKHGKRLTSPLTTEDLDKLEEVLKRREEDGNNQDGN